MAADGSATRGGLEAVQGEARAGDDVDHAQERICAVQRGAGTAEDLDAFHRGHRNEFFAEEVPGARPVVDFLPIDHHLDLAAAGPRARADPANADVVE